MNTPLRPRIFCLWLVIGTYILPFFFPVISWSYLRTEMSVILSIGNKLHSLHPSLFFSLSCETTLLMLSCDCIESANFIHSIQSPAKLVYYKKSDYNSLNSLLMLNWIAWKRTVFTFNSVKMIDICFVTDTWQYLN